MERTSNPTRIGHSRADEIKKWMDDRAGLVASYVIFDDDEICVGDHPVLGRMIHVDRSSGLIRKHVRQAK